MTDPTPLPRTGSGVRHVADLSRLEHDLREPKTTPLLSTRMPVQLDHMVEDRHAPVPNVDDLGRMSADAVRAQYEATAKAFEVMGEEVKDRIASLQASLEEANASMKLLEEAAKAIREQGKLAHMQIAEMSAVTKHIRELHDGVMKKVGRNGTA